jgi:hypothetical protein
MLTSMHLRRGGEKIGAENYVNHKNQRLDIFCAPAVAGFALWNAEKNS